MRVGLGVTVLNAGLVSGQLDGIGTYTRHLLGHLSVAPDCSLQTYAFAKEAFDPRVAGVQLLHGRYAVNAALTAISGVPFPGSASIKGCVDLFHAPDHYIPKLRGIPVVATLMDPIPLMRPEWASARLRRVKNWLFQRMVRTADHYVAISEFVVDDLVRYFRISPERITVIPLAVDNVYFNPVDEDEKRRALGKYNLKPGYFLFIGTLQPRKNLGRVIEAFLRLPEEIRYDYPLIIAGRAGWGVDDLLPKLAELDSAGVGRWLEYVPEEDKRALLQSAGTLVFPSLYEGFGLPVLEAFASRLPVITSNTTSLPEVAGDAAILVNPESVDEITDAMLYVVSDGTIRDRLIEKGLIKAQQMTWRQTAEKTLAVYRKVIG